MSDLQSQQILKILTQIRDTLAETNTQLKRIADSSTNSTCLAQNKGYTPTDNRFCANCAYFRTGSAAMCTTCGLGKENFTPKEGLT